MVMAEIKSPFQEVVQRSFLEFVPSLPGQYSGGQTLFTLAFPVPPNEIILYVRENGETEEHDVYDNGFGDISMYDNLKDGIDEIIGGLFDYNVIVDHLTHTVSIVVQGKVSDIYLDDYFLITYNSGVGELSYPYVVTYPESFGYHLFVESSFVVIGAFNASCIPVQVSFYSPDAGTGLCMSNYFTNFKAGHDLFSSSSALNLSCWIPPGQHNLFSLGYGEDDITHFLIARRAGELY